MVKHTITVVSSFIDSGAGHVLSMVPFSHSENKFIIARLMMWNGGACLINQQILYACKITC